MANIEPAKHSSNLSIPQEISILPGDIGSIARYIYLYSRYPEASISIAGAFSIYAGIIGRAFNTPNGAGLNTYTLFLAPTGVGKNVVKEARGRLFLELAKAVVAIEEFKGPGDLASAAGATRWLEKRPCCLSIFSEAGPFFKKITSPHANMNDVGIKRFILDAYSSSGLGSTIDPIAYSDRDKNTATIHGASYSIFAESAPESVLDSFHEGLISSGLLPRFDVWASNNPRPYINRNRIAEPQAALVQKLADVAAFCLANGGQGKVSVPTYGDGAEDRLYEFEAWTTDQINASGEVARQLWNRAFLKVEKLASLMAVGNNYLNPSITLAEVEWVTNLVASQTKNLVAKFASGEVGGEEGSETAQIKAVIGEICKFLAREYDNDSDLKFGVTYQMHKSGVIPQTYLSRKLLQSREFRDKYTGGTKALTKALATLIDSDELGEMPKLQMKELFGFSPRSYVVKIGTRFMPP